MVFEDEDEDEVVKQVMEHVSANHPEWGREKPPSKSGSRWRKRGKG